MVVTLWEQRKQPFQVIEFAPVPPKGYKLTSAARHTAIAHGNLEPWQ